ncbi:hypothetical protein ACFU53_36795 [Streptomyces sp. NPDC057474]|uniref:hypothetical protein n=1 Tax=Streptomyces sp. NPDC057474 TaxID=3346144 RepID=UPI003690F264
MVGWATADHLRTELVADALRSVCRRHRPAGPVIFPSECGCQYASHEFAVLTAKLLIRLSVGRSGQCWDCQSLRTGSRKDRVVPAVSV